MKFTVMERWYKTYEVEADSFEEAKHKVFNTDNSGELMFDDLAFITDEKGNEQIYS